MTRSSAGRGRFRAEQRSLDVINVGSVDIMDNWPMLVVGVRDTKDEESRVFEVQALTEPPPEQRDNWTVIFKGAGRLDAGSWGMGFMDYPLMARVADDSWEKGGTVYATSENNLLVSESGGTEYGQFNAVGLVQSFEGEDYEDIFVERLAEGGGGGGNLIAEFDEFFSTDDPCYDPEKPCQGAWAFVIHPPCSGGPAEGERIRVYDLLGCQLNGTAQDFDGTNAEDGNPVRFFAHEVKRPQGTGTGGAATGTGTGTSTSNCYGCVWAVGVRCCTGDIS